MNLCCVRGNKNLVVAGLLWNGGTFPDVVREISKFLTSGGNSRPPIVNGNPFLANVPILYPQETLDNQR